MFRRSLISLGRGSKKPDSAVQSVNAQPESKNVVSNEEVRRSEDELDASSWKITGGVLIFTLAAGLMYAQGNGQPQKVKQQQYIQTTQTTPIYKQESNSENYGQNNISSETFQEDDSFSMHTNEITFERSQNTNSEYGSETVIKF